MSAAIFFETRRDVQVSDQLQILAAIDAFGARVRPAAAARHYAARHGSLKWLDAGSVALHFVSTRDDAADSDKTSAPPPTRGLSHLDSLSMCSSIDVIYERGLFDDDLHAIIQTRRLDISNRVNIITHHLFHLIVRGDLLGR